MQIGTNSYHMTSVRNVPAFRSEPNMPPEDDIRPWILIFYDEDKKLTPEKYWKEVGKETAQAYAKVSKVDGDIKKIAVSVTANAADPSAKAAALLEYCQKNIKNVTSPTSGLTPAQREAFKPNRNTSETLKQKMGTGRDINAVFAALATAAGLEARLARVADRTDKGFDQRVMTDYFLRATNIAIKFPEGWRFYDAADSMIPPGSLRWQEEGAAALVADPKDPVLVQTPLAPAAKSSVSRLAELVIDQEGTADGKIRFGYTGHRAAERRVDFGADTPAERNQKALEQLQRAFPGAEIKDVAVSNVDDLTKPLVISAAIRVPNYAQRTGKRFFIAPSFFQANSKPRFAESARKYPVYFDYPWEENDRVVMELPDGFELDQPSAPGGFKIGETGEYSNQIALAEGGRKIITVRKFAFGMKDQIFFPVEAYPVLKKAFDAVHELDTHSLAMKQQ